MMMMIYPPPMAGGSLTGQIGNPSGILDDNSQFMYNQRSTMNGIINNNNQDTQSTLSDGAKGNYKRYTVKDYK